MDYTKQNIATLCLALFTLTISKADPQTEPMIIWTEKNVTDGTTRVMGIETDLSDWSQTEDLPPQMEYVRSLEKQIKENAHRVALTFSYKDGEIFWSDQYYQEIFHALLREHDYTSYSYNATANRIFHGTSSQVNGLAYDWLSGTLYWSDALYNWISIAKAFDFEVYNHLITTGLDKPMGLAVSPHKNQLFWSDWGKQPKIEQSELDGSLRRTLVDTRLNRPLGITVDYQRNLLYWVDDYQGSVNWINLETHIRDSFNVDTSQYQSLYGMAISHQYVLVSDIFHKKIKIYERDESNKHRLASNIRTENLPLDVIMYSKERQEEIPSECDTLACQHMCISTGDGGGKCACKIGYALWPGNKECIKSEKIEKPSFIYTIGEQICSVRVMVADTSDRFPPQRDISCFYRNVSHAFAMAYHSEAEMIFYSDSITKKIVRVKLVGDFNPEIIATSTGTVRGMAVDWMTGNLYWTDEDFGEILVTQLDGRYPKKLVTGLKQPRGIAVNPPDGVMYWTDAEDNVVYRANMDGTNITRFIHDMTTPDGITLDIRAERLYWVEENGIFSVKLDGSDKTDLVKAEPFEEFRDVTFYEDYYAYTDGQAGLHFGAKNYEEAKSYVHLDALSSHDIISYNDYLQPKLGGSCNENNGGCDQLCLPVPGKRVCACSHGYTIGSDGMSCSPGMITDVDYVLYVDPYMHQVFQIDLASKDMTPHGINLPQLNFPTLIDVETYSLDLHWLDQKSTVIKKLPLIDGAAATEEIVLVVKEHTSIDAFVVSSETREVIYSDSEERSILASPISRDKPPRILARDSPAQLMILDEYTGYLYWVEMSGQLYSIYRLQVYEKTDAVIQVFSRSEKIFVTQMDSRITALGLDVSEQNLYWCTNQIMYYSYVDGSEVKSFAKDNQASFHSIGITADYIFYSHINHRILYRMDKPKPIIPIPRVRRSPGTEVNLYNTTTVALTEPVHSEISCIKDFSWLKVRRTEKDREPQAVISDNQGVDLILLGGIVGGVVLLLLTILLVAILIWRRSRKRNVPKTDTSTEAHDNPTYVTAPGQTRMPLPDPPEPVYYTLPDGCRASAGSRDSELPDVVKLPLPDDEDFSSGGKVQRKESQRTLVDNEVVLTTDQFSNIRAMFNNSTNEN